MNETLIADSIKSAVKHSTQAESHTSVWLWIAIIEFIVIIFLFYQFRSRSKTSNLRNSMKEKSLKEEIDFGNIIQSSFHTQPLYDELKVKCHPDRFPNDEIKNKVADALFQEITKNKTNYKKLVQLKERAKQELNITF
jgi:hypothetical protein